jgi:glutamine---fructose-6-phosphate transaminase (isomerizing)
MCGIVGVVQGEPSREAPSISDVVRILEDAQSQLPFTGVAADLIQRLDRCVERVEAADMLLRGVPGVLCLVGDATASPRIASQIGSLSEATTRFEGELDGGLITTDLKDVERLNASIIRLKDAMWAVRFDRLRTAAGAVDLAGRETSSAALIAFAQMEIALAAIDRLEVRGRDSAGLCVVVRNHSLDLSASSVRGLWTERDADQLFRSLSVREADGNLFFVYKAAAEIGELGDNTRVIRGAVREDPLLKLALTSPDARALVLAHTRWASVGMISEANAHPLSSEEEDKASAPLVVGALNGDIDNFADLSIAEDIHSPLEVTTDAKIIPVLVGRRESEGHTAEEAFRRTVASFEGSVAIGAVSSTAPDRLLLALRGSGQALYIGFAEDAFVVASEPYGLVEQATSYLRMDGEARIDGSARGQIVVLDTARAGRIDGVRRLSYDGTELPVDENELQTPEITTRDVDRGAFPHFLLKEITEAPRSFRKTLQGKIVEVDGHLKVILGPDVIPEDLAEDLRASKIRHIRVIGVGTAAVAGRAVARAIGAALDPLPITVEALAATELSGFGLREDMSDTLVIAISQSGTTTDTNRTVEVVRARGAAVVAIVNRRQSDLTDRADGVLYTSDGRDVEMAVPSTKAFYAQVAAGFLLAAALAGTVEGATGVDGSVLQALRELPDAMQKVLDTRADIADVARRQTPMRRDWAVVGNGPNRIAAEEVRIKLSELCYKSIGTDTTEEKKHIDLSAEPLILICAAGLRGSNAEDIAKEVTIYRAHKAAPIVIAGEGEGRYEAAFDVIRVPSVHPDVAFVLSTVAGHLFGYEAALAIDAQALPLREARVAVETASEFDADGHEASRVFDRVRPRLIPFAARFNDGLRAGLYDGHLEPSTAVRVASLFRYVTGISPLDAFAVEFGKIGTPFEVLADFMEALTAGIDELTRPIDAIRHQAKTVTVGITRAEETLLQVPLVREVLAAGVARDRLTYGTLRSVAALDSGVDRVTGYTHYAIEGDVQGDAQVRITDRGGIARDIPSRTDRDPRLRGTKHRVAVERDVLVTRGHDGRTVVIVPEVKGTDVTGIALMHVRFKDRLPADVMRTVLQGYRDRYSALRDIVTETEPTFRDDLLAEIDVADLLVNSIQALAERWRSTS